jgi:hypothetical protein
MFGMISPQGAHHSSILRWGLPQNPRPADDYRGAKQLGLNLVGRGFPLHQATASVGRRLWNIFIMFRMQGI